VSSYPADVEEYIDARGWPALRKRKPAVALADAPAPAPRLSLAESVEVLTLAQIALEWGMSVEDAERVAVRSSLPRVVGWPRAAVEQLGERLRRDDGLRSELGVTRSIEPKP
jgi:hypothetical protein